MNKTIGFVFRMIPLCMALICFGLGWYILGNGNDPVRFLPGFVVFFLGSICIALFCTASIIIFQLTKNFVSYQKYVYPTLGYVFTVITFLAGLILLTVAQTPEIFIAGHIVCGLAFIAGCVSTAATASIKFFLIPKNSHTTISDTIRPTESFSNGASFVIKMLPVLFAFGAWIWGFSLLGYGTSPSYYVSGLVMLGLASICSCLIALVWSIEKQSANSYRPIERRSWPWFVIFMGCFSFLLGLGLLLFDGQSYIIAPGFVLMGLGLICFSISSKVILLAVVWKTSYPLANRIPLIPITTTLLCLFLSAFLYETASTNDNFYVPARVLTGLGAICFCLFSIVSILESGTKNNETRV